MKDKKELDLISREFAHKTFIGRVVTNWCPTCGKWRIHYVPQGKLPVDGFVEEETFPCTRCGQKLPLVIDNEHTILRNA